MALYTGARTRRFIMTIFGFFGMLLPDHYYRGEEIRIGRWICKVIFSIGRWHWLRRE